jgi:hypothetical protein
MALMSSVIAVRQIHCLLCGPIPAGSTAFDSSTSCVLRSDANTEGCAWGAARLKLDLVAIIDSCKPMHVQVMFAWRFSPSSGSRDVSRGCRGAKLL